MRVEEELDERVATYRTRLDRHGVYPNDRTSHVSISTDKLVVLPCGSSTWWDGCGTRRDAAYAVAAVDQSINANPNTHL